MRAMDENRRQRVERVYQDALKLPEAQRTAFIEESCKGDPELAAPCGISSGCETSDVVGPSGLGGR